MQILMMFSLSGVRVMFINELKKTVLKSRTIILLVVLLLINIGFMVSKIPESLKYTKNFRTITSLIQSDKLTVDQYLEFIDKKGLSPYSNHDHSNIENNILRFDGVMEALIDEGKNLESKKDIRLYQSKNAQKNLKMEIERNNYLQSLDYNFSNDYFINQIEKNDIIKITSIVFVLYLMYDVFYDSIKYNLLDFDKTLKFGRKKSYIIKLLVISFVVLVFIVFSTILKILFIHGSLNDIFVNTGYIKALENLQFFSSYINYVLLNGLVIYILSLFVGIIFLFILMLTKNMTITITSFVFLLASGFLFTNYISPNSTNNILAYFNIFSIIFMNTLEDNTFNLLSSTLTVAMPLILTSILITILGSLFSYSLMGRTQKRFLFRNPSISLKFVSLTIHNLVNLLWNQKLILPIIIVFSYSIYQYQTFSVVKNIGEVSFETYQMQFLGEITDNTFVIIEEEKDKLIEAEKNLDYLMNNQESLMTISEEEMSHRINNKSNLEQVILDIETINNMGNSYYSNDKGAQLLFFVNSKFYNAQFMSILLLLTIILSSVSGGYEKYLGIEELAHTTVKGYKRNSSNKYLLMNGFVNITTILVLILNFMKVSSNFSLDTKAPLLEVINVSNNLTVFQGYIFLSINVLIVTNLLFYITFKLSKHFDYILTMMTTFMITFLLLWIGVFTKLP